MHTVMDAVGEVFDGKRVAASRDMRLDAPPRAVFPLLCPVLEYDWIEHWRCTLAYSESGVAELGCTFVTDFPERGREVWTCTEYRPDKAVTWLRVHPERTVCLDLKLEPDGEGGCRLFWAATATGVTEAGNTFVEKVFAPGYEQEMQLIETMLSHYLATGEALPSGPSLDQTLGQTLGQTLAEQRG